MWNEVLEDLIVVKRSGQRVDFNASKIAIAIKNAFDSVYETSDEKSIYKVFERVLKYINDNYKDRKTINVEDIQDIIESMLKDEKYLDVYNSFSEYRKKRTASRKVFAEKQQHKFVKAIEKIQEDNNKKMDTFLSPYNTLYKFGRIVSNEYTKSYVLDTKFVRAFDEGNIYIHDLDYFALGLLSSIHLKLDNQINEDLSIDNLISEIISAQNEINGEIAIDGIDYLLSPLILTKYKNNVKKNINNYLRVSGFIDFINIRKIEELIDKELDLNFNIFNYNQFINNNHIQNIFESAFSDAQEEVEEITYSLIRKIFYSLEKNHEHNIKYSISTGTNETQIGLLINKTIFEIIKSNEKLNFVTLIIKIKNNNDLINKVAELIINKKNVEISLLNSSYNKNTKNDVEYFSNGCRIFENINDPVNLSTGRMVIGTTSINLARLGLKYQNKDQTLFFKELDTVLDTVKNELLLTFETIGNKNRANYGALFNGNVYDDEKLEGNQKIRKVIKNGILNVGLIGLKECVLSLEKDENKEYDLLLKILKYVNLKCQNYSEETKLNFGLFEPNDFKSRKDLIAIDKSIYGIRSNITDKNNYELLDSFKIINSNYEKMSEIQKLFNNGWLITINLPNNITNKKVIDQIKQLIACDVGFVKIKVGK